MKKLATILLLAILSGCTTHPEESSTDASLLKQTQNWQTLGENGWQDFRSVEYQYNDHDLLINETASRILGDSLIPQFRLLRTYNENGDITSVKRETWATNQWVFATRSSYVYQGDKITQRIDSVSGSNAALTYVTYKYDSKDRLISETGLKNVEGTLVPHSMVRYTYNDKDLPIIKEFPRWSDGTWIKARKMELKYNEGGSHIQTTRLNWVDDSWKLHLNYLLEIDDQGNRLSELWQRSNENGMEDFMKVSYTYVD